MLVWGGLGSVSHGEEIGSVDTAFKMLGPDDKIVIEAFDDPKVAGVSCHLSRAKTGGIKGGVGLAEDTADASIACRQIGAIKFGDIKDGEEVFSKSTSILFKKMRIVRFFDRKRNVLVYLVYSDKLIDGSPKNSISSVPIMPWHQEKAPESKSEAKTESK
ncbi:MAG: CreA family protein [Magnetococcales bacterium]|nr:CreA family protein [Magnetococcales bacterium]